MKRIVILVMVFLFVLSVPVAHASVTIPIGDFSEGLAWMKKSELYGFVDTHGNWVVEPIYETATSFVDGYAFVSNDDGESYVDVQGNIVSGPAPDYSRRHSEGVMVISKGSTYQYVAIAPDAVVPAETYEFAGTFSDGLACVTFGPEYTAAFIDHQGQIVILMDDEWGRITDTSKIKVNGAFPAKFIDGYAVVEGFFSNTEGTKTGGDVVVIIDLDGNKLYIHEEESEIRNCGNGIFCIYDSDKKNYYFADANGVNLTGEVYSGKFEQGRWNGYDTIVENGIALAGIDRKGVITPCFIDMTGQVVIPNDGWDGASPFYEGLAAVRKDGKWGYINTSGEYVIEPKYNVARPFSCGVAIVSTEEEWFIIDAQGNVLY